MAITYHCKKTSAALEHPYMLSFGTVHTFDSVMTYLLDDDRLIGVGESTALPGYSKETQDDIYQWSSDFLELHAEKLPDQMHNIICKQSTPGFLQASLLSAIESAIMHSDIFAMNEIAVPIIGLVTQRAYSMLQAEIESLVSRYNTLKMKIGMDVFFDAQRVRMVQMLVPEQTKIRLDANQAFTYNQIEEFLYWIDPDQIQYIEQPLPIDQWDEMAKLNAAFPQFNFMLDESISSIDDIDRAADMNCCHYIKLKLFKCGSVSRTIDLARHAHERGLKVILGNGVQNIIGALYEAYIYHQLLNLGIDVTATESIGPLKLRVQPESLFQLNGATLVLNPKQILVHEYHHSQLLQPEFAGSDQRARFVL